MIDHTPGVVIFDLDGTLVDSAPDIAASVAFALRELECEVPAIERIKTYVGNGAARLIHRSLTGTLDGVADEALYEAASPLFFDHYAENVCRDSRAFPEVAETLDRIRVEGYRLACATNKPARFTEPLLDALHLGAFFELIISGDSLARKKPDPDQLLHIAAHCSASPQRCLMVGDSATDLLAAKNAGMPAVVLTYGYGEPKEFRQHGPLAIIDAFSDVLHFLPPIGVAGRERVVS